MLKKLKTKEQLYIMKLYENFNQEKSYGHYDIMNYLLILNKICEIFTIFEDDDKYYEVIYLLLYRFFVDFFIENKTKHSGYLVINRKLILCVNKEKDEKIMKNYANFKDKNLICYETNIEIYIKINYDFALKNYLKLITDNILITKELYCSKTIIEIYREIINKINENKNKQEEIDQLLNQ